MVKQVCDWSVLQLLQSRDHRRSLPQAGGKRQPGAMSQNPLRDSFLEGRK